MPHQLTLHQSKSKRLIAVTGRQIGKTFAIVNEIIKRSVQHPNTRNWYVTNDYAQAKRNVWDIFKHFTPKEIIDGKPNESELSIKLVNGSRMELIGVSNAESLRGARVHFMGLDEYKDFPRHIWPTVLEPMFTTTNGDAWFLGTPGGIGNDLYDKYHDSGFERFKYPSCEMEGDRVTSTLSKYASLEQIQKAHDDDSSPGKLFFRQEYLGEFTRPMGTVYAQWPLDNFTQVDYDPHLPLFLTFDFGVNDPTAIVWLQAGNGEFRVIDYVEAVNADVGYFAQLIKSKPYKEPSQCFGDPAGKARAITNNISPIDEYGKHGIHITVKEGVKIHEQIAASHPHIKSLFVSEKLTRFRDCILNYRYPEKAENLINQSNEKPIHDEFSHAMRALEYFFVNYSPLQADAVVNDFSAWRI